MRCAFLVGNAADLWAREKAVGRIAEVIGHIKDGDLIAGVAGHELRTPRVCEAGSVDPDFYVKTLHDRELLVEATAGSGSRRHRQLRDRQLLVPGAGERDRVHVPRGSAVDRVQGARRGCDPPEGTDSSTRSRTVPISRQSACSTSRWPKTSSWQTSAYRHHDAESAWRA